MSPIASSHSKFTKGHSTLPPTIEWIGGLDGHVRMIDQTRLPDDLVMLECHDVDTVWNAIKRLSVRGAPAIGIAAVYGAVLGIRNADSLDRTAFLQRLDEVCDFLRSSRPTGANLSWALARMRRCAHATATKDVTKLKETLLQEAKRIRDEDTAMCRAIGTHGEKLIRSGATVMTHCNAGALATSEFGTALAPMYVAHEQGRSFRVMVPETRPLLQGSRLTAWELQQAGIDVTVFCDSTAAAVMQQRKVDLVLVGADRIAANGDVANKIGTYGLAVLAQHHRIPFYVAAPTSTFDLATADGSTIPIEQRDADEIRRGFGTLTAPRDVDCYCPAFDVTPAGLIHGIITERGMIQPVSAESIQALLRA